MDHNRSTAFMDWVARVWQSLGVRFGVRPATIIGITVGALLFASSLTYILVSQNNVRKEVSSITSAFCNGQAPRTPEIEANCRALLDQLLLNPTPMQKKRIRQIAQEGK